MLDDELVGESNNIPVELDVVGGGSEARMTSTRFRRICVFCGSSSGEKEHYQKAAVQLANELVRRKVDLVYGGGSVGLMGIVSRAVHHGGRNVLGIMPTSVIGRELTGETVGDLIEVATMHERKALMSHHSDAFITLPGGYGTLEELLEVISWAQLGIHNKPVGLLNVEGYYDSLLDFIDKAVSDGFIKPHQRHLIVSASSVVDLLQKLEDHIPPVEHGSNVV